MSRCSVLDGARGRPLDLPETPRVLDRLTVVGSRMPRATCAKNGVRVTDGEHVDTDTCGWCARTLNGNCAPHETSGIVSFQREW